MAFPNLVGLIGLKKVIIEETELFINELKGKKKLKDTGNIEFLEEA